MTADQVEGHNPAGAYRARCLVEPGACDWEYAADRAVMRDAAWRLHYAAHARGRAIVDAFRARAATLTHATEKPTQRERL